MLSYYFLIGLISSGVAILGAAIIVELREAKAQRTAQIKAKPRPELYDWATEEGPECTFYSCS